jgi:hypothetical protein
MICLTRLIHSDLTEGKFSFPIIHAITTQPTDRRLLSTSLFLNLSLFLFFPLI